LLGISEQIDSGLSRQIHLVQSNRHVTIVVTFHQEYIAIMEGQQTSLMSGSKPPW